MTFLPCDNFFFSSDILWYLFFPYPLFLFFSSTDKFVYLFLACSPKVFWSFHNNLLLYLVSRLCFFDNNLNQHSRSFLYITKIYLSNTPFINQVRTIRYINCFIFSQILKMNSVCISFNINNRNIIKARSFLH